jgi:hypothetical protein
MRKIELAQLEIGANVKQFSRGGKPGVGISALSII